MYSTSHLFAFGDLNFRLSFPKDHEFSGTDGRPAIMEALSTEEGRARLKEYDQLVVEQRKRTVFQGLKEGDFWKFKASHLKHLGSLPLN